MKIKRLLFYPMILLSLFTACNNPEPKNFELKPLPPGAHQFKSGLKFNRIDYFYIPGGFSYQQSSYARLEKKVSQKVKYLKLEDYDLYSVYIYQETAVINGRYKGVVTGLDGQNKNLIAYIRYKQNDMDTFYIIRNGNVVYDLLLQQETNFEFDQ